MTNRAATTIVPINRVFSKPLRVWNPELKASLPPKEPPRPASDRCKSTRETNTIDNAICIYGSIEAITVI